MQEGDVSVKEEEETKEPINVEEEEKLLQLEGPSNILEDTIRWEAPGGEELEQREETKKGTKKGTKGKKGKKLWMYGGGEGSSSSSSVGSDRV